MTALTLTVWRHHENKTIFVYSNATFFCLFVKLLMKRFQSFSGSNHLWLYNHLNAICVMTSSGQKNYICLNADFFCLLEKLLLIWIATNSWKHPSLSLQSWWSLSFNCIIKTRKFLFPWTQISSIWKTAVDMNFKGFIEPTIHEPIIMMMPMAWRRNQNMKIFCLYECWMLLFIW